MKHADYTFTNKLAARKVIKSFLYEMSQLQESNLGNGRLMRKLFQTAISYKAERDEKEFNMMQTIDLQKAANEILQSERILSNQSHTNIGFIKNE
ncbi:hypothetical protein J9303_01800 [Bacillaceae bacterium Marseille-Q3522]|nr:hypothetical protein [Bacillaceae bacterium Marseille-Q3522]